jgi:hypothetical protein
MILARIWQARDGDVAVPDRLDLEDATAIGNLVKGPITVGCRETRRVRKRNDSHKLDRTIRTASPTTQTLVPVL